MSSATSKSSTYDNDSQRNSQEHADDAGRSESALPFAEPADSEQSRALQHNQDAFSWDTSAGPLEVGELLGEIEAQDGNDADAPVDEQEQTQGQPQASEEEPILPFDKRPSYVRIAHRLKQVRVTPALVACGFALLVTGAVCGAEMVVHTQDISAALALVSCSAVGFVLAAISARTKSHSLLVGLVLLEVLYTLYAIAFGVVGIFNVKLLKKDQVVLQEDDTMQEEQRENALRILKRQILEYAVFSGLYFFVSASHCCAAASVNHLRAAVRKFDSRLRRKRQRARALRKLGLNFGPDLDHPGTALETGAEEVATIGTALEEPQDILSEQALQGQEPETDDDPEALQPMLQYAPLLESSSSASGSRNESNHTPRSLQDVGSEC